MNLRPIIYVVCGAALVLSAGLGLAQAPLDFGDDRGAWAKDIECDDPRFIGEGMAEILLDEDLFHDASDCLVLFEQGAITVRDIDPASPTIYGSNISYWANDGACDDPRFEGEGMAATLSDEDRYNDASDCADLFQRGLIRFRQVDGAAASVEFGDNSSVWANDGECDDPRFEGEGIAANLFDEDAYADASDCLALFQNGSIALREAPQGPRIVFGDDSNQWSRDLECDDPRFVGSGMAVGLTAENAYRDASDCREFFEQGLITLRESFDDASGILLSDQARIGFLHFNGRTSEDGRNFDVYRLAGQAGQNVAISASSSAFLPSISVLTPSRIELDGAVSRELGRMLIEVTLTETSPYEIRVTSLRSARMGRYTIGVNAPLRRFTEMLEDGDETLPSGEFVDSYTFEGLPGQYVAIELTSEEFDTYLMLHDPAGDQEDNDDADGMDTNSRIEAQLTEGGIYEVKVTSYEPGETGTYTLTIEQSN